MKKIALLSLLFFVSCKKQTVQPIDIIHHKIINIGVWDMEDLNSISIVHGLDYSKIRTVDCMIKSDIGNLEVSLLSDGSITPITDTYITLNINPGGGFDMVAFSSNTNNRGYLTVGYVE